MAGAIAPAKNFGPGGRLRAILKGPDPQSPFFRAGGAVDRGGVAGCLVLLGQVIVLPCGEGTGCPTPSSTRNGLRMAAASVPRVGA